MAHAELCPVCSGAGVLPPDWAYSSSAGLVPGSTCHGCGGLGWVSVADGPGEFASATTTPSPPVVDGVEVMLPVLSVMFH